MALVVTHPLVSAVPDGADTSLVQPSDWNADHTIVGTLTAWTPTFTASSGSFTTVTVGLARYLEIGKWVVGVLDYTITTAGTATGVTFVTAPVTPRSGTAGHISGTETSSTGYLVGGQVTSALGLVIRRYDGTSVITTGYRFICNFGYEAA